MPHRLRAAALVLGTLLLAAPATPGPASGGSAASEEDLSSPALFALRGLTAGPLPPEGPRADGDVAVTTHAAAQNEPAVAVNPTDPLNVLAAWNDYSAASGSTQVWDGIGNSLDGGKTWNSRLLTPNPTTAPGPVKTVFNTAQIPFTHGGDPILGFNQFGVGLVGQIIFSSSLSESAISVQATPDKGNTFGPMVLAAWSGVSAPDGFTDKPWMRGDLKRGSFYLCWTHFSSGFSVNRIMFTASHDGLGAVWSAPIDVSTEQGVQGCDIGILPNGEVVVVYLDYVSGLASGGPIKMVKSTDQGVTFSLPSQVAVAGALSLPNAAFRYNGFPRIAVDAASGAMYVAWAEGAGGDIVLTKSTDGGATWAAKKKVNNDATTRAQYFPAIDVGPDGKVVVGFYDRREDPANRLAKYYLAESADGGATFPVQVAAGGSTIDGLNTRWWFMGDYTDLRIGSDGKPHAVWTASPGTNQDIYTNV